MKTLHTHTFPAIIIGPQKTFGSWYSYNMWELSLCYTTCPPAKPIYWNVTFSGSRDRTLHGPTGPRPRTDLDPWEGWVKGRAIFFRRILLFPFIQLLSENLRNTVKLYRLQWSIIEWNIFVFFLYSEKPSISKWHSLPVMSIATIDGLQTDARSKLHLTVCHPINCPE